MDVTKLDAVERLAWDAKHAAAILLNGSDIELVDLQTAETAKNISAARDLAFVGVIGMLQGEPRMALETPMDAETVTAVTQAFLHHVRETGTWACVP